MADDSYRLVVQLEHTFKAQVVRDVERCVLPGQSVLSKAAMRRPHLMKRSDTVARLKLVNILANGMNESAYVITAIVWLIWVEYFW
jgi:hypothetical protein